MERQVQDTVNREDQDQDANAGENVVMHDEDAANHPEANPHLHNDEGPSYRDDCDHDHNHDEGDNVMATNEGDEGGLDEDTDMSDDETKTHQECVNDLTDKIDSPEYDAREPQLEDCIVCSTQLYDSENDGEGTTRSICAECQSQIAEDLAENDDRQGQPALLFGSVIATFVVHGQEDKVDANANELDLTEVIIPAPPTNTCAHCRNKWKCIHDSARFKKRETPIISIYRLRPKCEGCFHRSYGGGTDAANRQIVNCKHVIPREGWKATT